MPYIKQENRDKIDKEIDALIKEINCVSDNELNGILNYIITRLITSSMKDEIKYNKINNLIGVLECVKLEFYRKIAFPYEDSKAKENGDIKETMKCLNKLYGDNLPF